MNVYRAGSFYLPETPHLVWRSVDGFEFYDLVIDGVWVWP